ncbi:tetratricopeptide repeat protein [Streptomyces sp. NPDC051105]|uniref:tetratricopeptide repeat protein n=1 Tax=Streptomyces sp. NPDC051105 TaxID=3154843 RepID=UPI00342CAA58
MAVQKISRQELIRQRRRDGFVGRQGELAALTDTLSRPPEAAAEFLFHIHGPAGVGKSTLLRRMESEARERQAVTGYVDESVADVVEAMEALSTQCSQQGVALKSFDKALAVYRQRRHEVDAASGPVPGTQLPAGESETGSGPAASTPSPGSLIAAQVGLVGLGMLPGVGAFTGAVDPHQVAAGADRMKAMLSTRFRNHDDIQLVMSPVKVLTPLFLQDLAEVAQRRPWVALFVDTYERTGPLLDVWLRDILTSDRYGELPANVLVVLAGQNRLDTRTWADCLDLVTDLPLEVFTEAEARRFLSSKGITDERTVEVILRLSGRLPVLLSTLAEARPASAEDVGDPSGTAVERFLKWETDPTRRAAALACAIPQEIDEDVYRISVGEDAAGQFDWLRSLPFVTDRAGRCQYHDVVRDTMLRLQRQQSRARWKDQHTRLAVAFRRQRAQLEEGVPPENGWWESQDWRSLRLQETYHCLCADPHAALSQTLRELLDAYDHGTATLRRWVQTLIQVGRDADASEVLDWGRQLLTALDLDHDQHPEIRALSLLMARAHLSPDGKAFAHLLCGRDHRNADQYEDAIIQYDKSIALNSRSSRAYYGRGITYRLMGRHEEALADLNRAIEIAPQDGSNFAQRGFTYILSARYEEALADLNRAIELDPQDAWNFAQRGVAHLRVDRYEEALADLNCATELVPDHEWAIAHRGVVYRALSQYDESLVDLNRAIELDPQDAWNFGQRGVTHRLMDRYEESLADLNHATELKPNYEWVIAQRGTTHRLMGRYEEALADLNHATELNPQGCSHFTERGITYQDMGRHEEALADLNHATELNPDYEWAIAQRGVTHRLMDRYEESLTDLNHAIELKPDYEWAIAQRGFTHRLMGRHEEALADLNRATEIAPQDAWNFAQRGVTHRLMGRHEEALADLNRAIELEPQDSSHFAERGITHRLMERYEEALTDLNHATELKPDYDWAIAQRSITHRLMGRYEEALTDLNHAIELEPQDSSHFAERGITYQDMGRYEEALADLNQATELKPDYDWAIAHRGITHRLMGRYEEALTDLNHAIELEPQDSSHFAERGITHQDMGRYEEALADLNHATELKPDYDWAIAHRGITHRHLGRYEEALTDLNHAIELDPQDGWCLYEKGLILHLTEDPSWQLPIDRAVEIFARDATGTGPRSVNGKGNLFIACCAISRWDIANQHLTNFLNTFKSKNELKEVLTDLEELTCVIPSLRDSTSGFQDRLRSVLS